MPIINKNGNNGNSVITNSCYKPGSLWKTRQIFFGQSQDGKISIIPYDSIVMLVAYKIDHISHLEQAIVLWKDKPLLLLGPLDVGHDFDLNPTTNEEEEEKEILSL